MPGFEPTIGDDEFLPDREEEEIKYMIKYESSLVSASKPES